MKEVVLTGKRASIRFVLFIICFVLPLVAFFRSAAMLRETNEQLEVSYDPSIADTVHIPVMAIVRRSSSLSSSQDQSSSTMTTPSGEAAIQGLAQRTLSPTGASQVAPIVSKTTKASAKPPKFAHSFKVPGNVTPTRENRIIYLMHIHKNAGSTMCKAAVLNKVPAYAKMNCNVQTDQRCCGNNDTLAAQQQYAQTTNLSFVAAERDMYEALDTEHYRYIIVLRKSRDRYLSHYKHVVRAVKYNQTFSYWWRGQPDNFSFRKVCGTKCSNVPKYHISKRLFDYTLERFAQFDDFIFQDDFKNSYIRFAQRVGWTLVPGSIHNKSPNLKPSAYPGLTGWDSHMDALENALYEYAQQRNKRISQPVFSDEVQRNLRLYFAQGPSRNCTLPCCAEKCSTYR